VPYVGSLKRIEGERHGKAWQGKPLSLVRQSGVVSVGFLMRGDAVDLRCEIRGRFVASKWYPG
jgi:hypothetical protein